ncbi:MAG: hypothetical protein WBA74_24125 [Cyclobacteriaceae bacterium]
MNKKIFNCKKPEWLFFKLTEWVHKMDMTEQEKLDNPTYKTTGAYLKVYNYQEVTRNLPNFDNNVFKQIFGFSAYE